MRASLLAAASTDPPSTPLWLTLLIAAVGGLAGVVVGYFLRGSELRRDQRSKVYGEFVQSQRRMWSAESMGAHFLHSYRCESAGPGH